MTDKLPDEFKDKSQMDVWLDNNIRRPNQQYGPFSGVPNYTSDSGMALHLMELFCQNNEEICHGVVARVGCDLDIPFAKISRFMPDMLEKVPTESAWRVDARPKAFAICLCIYKAYKAIEGEEEQQ